MLGLQVVKDLREKIEEYEIQNEVVDSEKDNAVDQGM